ncbi:NAD(P)-dependent alcohol dehydrogenase [Candidatus Bipolaricaulota bacterium]
MRAIVWTEYGAPDVLLLQEVPKPIPKDNEVLIRIHATTVTAGDCEMRRMKPALRYRLLMRLYVGLARPQRITILGMELAGEIEAVGSDVTRFQKGDEVFAATGFAGQGACAEYICLPEEPQEGALALKPASMTCEEAAPVPMGGLEALHHLRQGNIQSGQKVLINGAGGTIGTFAVQLAKYFGAEVTAVDSTRKLDMLRSIGADHVVDYTHENFTRSGETYDFILDVVGKGSFAGSMRSLSPDGRYLLAVPGLSQIVRGRWTSRTSNKKVIFGAAHPNTEDLLFFKKLIEEGKVRSVIDRRYSLEQTAEAHRYVETGQKAGHVIITVGHEGA